MSSDGKIFLTDAETDRTLDASALGTLVDNELVVDPPIDTSAWNTPGVGTTLSAVLAELETRIDALENP